MWGGGVEDGGQRVGRVIGERERWEGGTGRALGDADADQANEDKPPGSQLHPIRSLQREVT
jgi:hypothetical protein